MSDDKDDEEANAGLMGSAIPDENSNSGFELNSDDSEINK
ncbi:hypothetical protein A2U01_0089184, partial [Trifolium medium]|nr:hypothetical protein [Trifolium medium]